MKVFDGFAFFNELDLLELRLRELWDVVDQFIVVEATRTFQKKEKPLFFQKNRDRFRKYDSKIKHIIVDRYPTFWTKFRPVTTWHYDNHQKEQILQGLDQAEPTDQVIISDLDEIPFPEKVIQARNIPGVKVVEHFQSYYYLNYVCTRINDYGGQAVAQRNRNGFGRWRGSVILPKNLIKSVKRTRDYRDEEGPGITSLTEGGWHFSNMGGIEALHYKMQAWAHKEYNSPEFTSLKKLAQNIIQGTDSIGENMKYELFNLEDPKIPWPKTLLQDPQVWKHMITDPEKLQRDLQPFLQS